MENAGAVLGDGLEGVVDVAGGGDGVVDPDELLIVEEVAEACGPAVRVGDFECVTHGTVDVAEEGEGEVVFVGKGFLLGNGVHGDSEGADFGVGEFLH